MKILILAAFFISLNSHACSCMPFPKIEKLVKSAELILQGTTIRHFVDELNESSGFPYPGARNNYSVNRIYKVLKDEVNIREYFERSNKIQTFYASVNNGANCGLDLRSKTGTEYIAIIPSVEKSEFGYAKLPLYVRLSSCTSYQYILNRGAMAETYRQVLNLLEK